MNELPKMDLALILERVVRENQRADGASAEQIQEAEVEYRDFWRQCRQNPGFADQPISNHLVDEIWHAHVLHTKIYAQDCEEYFGYFLHHTPLEAM